MNAKDCETNTESTWKMSILTKERVRSLRKRMSAWRSLKQEVFRTYLYLQRKCRNIYLLTKTAKPPGSRNNVKKSLQNERMKTQHWQLKSTIKISNSLPQPACLWAKKKSCKCMWVIGHSWTCVKGVKWCRTCRPSALNTLRRSSWKSWVL